MKRQKHICVVAFSEKLYVCTKYGDYGKKNCAFVQSHPAWGGWIEITIHVRTAPTRSRPTPHGVGGLKWLMRERIGKIGASHPAWGGWIEITAPDCCSSTNITSHPAWGGWIEIGSCTKTAAPRTQSHPAWGGWIEMMAEISVVLPFLRPTPHGVGGLKLAREEKQTEFGESHPAWGGWIEMKQSLPGWMKNGAVPPRMGWVD